MDSTTSDFNQYFSSENDLLPLENDRIHFRVEKTYVEQMKIDETDEKNDDQSTNIQRQMSAHIPDIVLDNLENLSIPHAQNYDELTLLFLDVSGFTMLTERYSNDADLGVEQLTCTLNGYFHKLVSQILVHSGDIYKFAGDAILAIWTDRVDGPRQALNCAIKIQEKFGTYETDVSVVLRLKIALAYGSARLLFVGNDEFKHYILTGDCVREVNRCEQVCQPGDVLISQSVYDQIDNISSLYVLSTRDNYLIVRSRKINDRARRETNEMLKLNKIKLRSMITPKSSLMNSFLLNCVSQRIERQQPLEYLSELRRVTVSFINLDLDDEKLTSGKDLFVVQEIFVIIHDLTKMMGGVLTKAIAFDKGWSFLSVFGLPGYKQGDDTAKALKCGQLIRSRILNLHDLIKQCSIGITTGLTFCGVVGHISRCEYTVIGRKVNMAARLMCNYPNLISCDQETVYNSHLRRKFFRKLVDKTLKGMENVGSICEFISEVPSEKEKLGEKSSEIYPLLNRRIELLIVAAQVVLLDEKKSRRRRDLNAIIFQGEDKIGRTHLLQYLVKFFETNHSKIHLVHFRCQFEQRFNEFSLLRSLLRILLKFDANEKSSFERQQTLLHLFETNKTEDLYLKKNLFLFNDLLDVNFHRDSIDNKSNNDESCCKNYPTIIDLLISRLVDLSIDSSGDVEKPSKILFIIDDIHLADETSLKHLLTFGDHQRSLLILSMKPTSFSNNDRPTANVLSSIVTDARVYQRRLTGLETRFLPSLACQILGVDKLPLRLVEILEQNCNGIPGFCEEILLDLLYKEIIFIEEESLGAKTDGVCPMVEGDRSKLSMEKSTNLSLLRTIFSHEKKTEGKVGIRVCRFRADLNSDFEDDCKKNLENYLMCRVDRLSGAESLLVKISAVIGQTFSRSFLSKMIDVQYRKSLNLSSSILELMQRRVIQCVHSKNAKKVEIRCFCPETLLNFPSQCRLMEFCDVSIRKGILNSLTESLKSSLIRQAVDYLENHCRIVCSNCCRESEMPFYFDRNNFIKTYSSQTFADIVHLAALKDIDQSIRQIFISRSINSRKIRSNTTIEPTFLSSNNHRTSLDENSTRKLNDHFQSLIIRKNVRPKKTRHCVRDLFRSIFVNFLGRNLRRTNQNLAQVFFLRDRSLSTLFFVSKRFQSQTEKSSRWRKVRQLLIESDDALCKVDRKLELPSSKFHRTFVNLHEASLKSVEFRSYDDFFNENSSIESESSKSCGDLRVCQCADYVYAVYLKLIEYYTKLLKISDRRDESRSNLFDRIVFYRSQICFLLVRSNFLQRLIVEIEHGKKFVEQTEIDDERKFSTKIIWNYFQAIVLTRTDPSSPPKSLVEQSLEDLHKFPAQVDRFRFDLFVCLFSRLENELVAGRKVDFLEKCLERGFHRFPLEFSVPILISLIENEFYRENFSLCSTLLENFLSFHSAKANLRDNLELAKVKTIRLIVDLKMSKLDRAISSGYEARKILAASHENLFLLENFPHLTLALIGEMKISSIDFILQHLDYLTEQTMNFEGRFWFYLLLVDVAVDLGFQIFPINIEFLSQLSKYRDKLQFISNKRNLLLFYADSLFAQIYIRLGRLNLSKKHFQRAIVLLKNDSHRFSNTDFRFHRALTKLIEVQLISLFYENLHEIAFDKESLLFQIVEQQILRSQSPWNRSRFFIYSAYFERLVDKSNESHNWKILLEKAKADAVLLDCIWIEQLTTSWQKQIEQQHHDTWPLQRFIDFRSFLAKKSPTLFSLYILPI